MEVVSKYSEFLCNDIIAKKNNKSIEYIDIIASFDIETSSFIENGIKQGLMYLFSFNINHKVYIGRTWDDFDLLINTLIDFYNLNDKRRIIVWVHNLSFEFQFMCRRYKWDKVFATEFRKVCYCVYSGIEFRCSYMLSGLSLAGVAKTYNIATKKLDGYLDYEKIRTPETPISDTELEYSIVDSDILISYIEIIHKRYYSLGDIPITKTAVVRGDVKKACNSWGYKKLMMSLSLTPELYNRLKEAFAGGYTHGNLIDTGKIIHNVGSFDFNSAYPAAMLSEYYPLSRGEHVPNITMYEFKRDIKKLSFIITLNFKEIEIRGDRSAEYISESKCNIIGYKAVHNGRLLKASDVTMTITEQDFYIIRDFYTWKECNIIDCYYFYKHYLPKEFILKVLEYYQKKTSLKGIPEEEIEYILSKENLNSLYGMSVTDICRDEIIFNNSWADSEEKAPDIIEAINKYNTSKSRFLFYPWGVYITAYTRRNLFSGIKEFGADWIYGDTDSIKVTHYKEHLNYIIHYNNEIQRKIRNCLRFYRINEELAAPLTSKGVKKPLGIWDFEGEYSHFKTLGAKRYMVVKDGEISLTVSGLNKAQTIPYILDKVGVNYIKEDGSKGIHFKLSEYSENDVTKIFNFFTDLMFIPAEHTGNNELFYRDEATEGTIIDYMGNSYDYREESSVYFQKREYHMNEVISGITLLIDMLA